MLLNARKLIRSGAFLLLLGAIGVKPLLSSIPAENAVNKSVRIILFFVITWIDFYQIRKA